MPEMLKLTLTVIFDQIERFTFINEHLLYIRDLVYHQDSVDLRIILELPLIAKVTLEFVYYKLSHTMYNNVIFITITLASCIWSCTTVYICPVTDISQRIILL